MAEIVVMTRKGEKAEIAQGEAKALRHCGIILTGRKV